MESWPLIVMAGSIIAGAGIISGAIRHLADRIDNSSRLLGIIGDRIAQLPPEV